MGVQRGYLRLSNFKRSWMILRMTTPPNPLPPASYTPPQFLALLGQATPAEPRFALAACVGRPAHVDGRTNALRLHRCALREGMPAGAAVQMKGIRGKEELRGGTCSACHGRGAWILDGSHGWHETCLTVPSFRKRACHAPIRLVGFLAPGPAHGG